MSATLTYDDGAVVYLNGTEIFRIGMPEGPITHLTRASASSGEYPPVTTTASAATLVQGDNVLAVEIHQGNASSSDISFALELVGEGDVAPTVIAIEPVPGAVVRDLNAITVRFSEPVVGVARSDLLVNGQPIATRRIALPGNLYRWEFAPPPFGVVDVQFSALHGITDLNLNSFGGGRWTYTMPDVERVEINLAIQGRGTIAKSPDKPSYGLGDKVTLTAIPGRWFGFTAWDDGAENPRVITVDLLNQWTAFFAPTTALETLTFGNISRLAPAGMPAIFVDGEFVVDAATRLDATSIALESTFPNGSIFYTLDGSTPDFGSILYLGPFILRRSEIVRAVAYDASFLSSWEADPIQVRIEPTFTVTAGTPGGGTIEVSPSGASFPRNTWLSLTAIPDPGWTFLQWLGDAQSTNPTVTVHVLNHDLCVQALFGTSLATAIAGNGSVALSPTSTIYPYGTIVQLTAIPSAGHYFAAWGNAALGTNNPLLYSITRANPAISSAFGPLNAGQTALTIAVIGHGRVATSPHGNRLPVNQTVTLTAVPDADQTFIGWSGDASGTSSNLILQMAQSRVITAVFSQRPRLAMEPCLLRAGEDFRLTVIGEMGGRYRIDRSTGLDEWNVLATFTNTFGRWQLIDPIDPARPETSRRFYRAVEAP